MKVEDKEDNEGRPKKAMKKDGGNEAGGAPKIVLPEECSDSQAI